MTAPTTIDAIAPGKVVLWGEYAVLAGAPALVMAVDRFARCTLAPSAAPEPGAAMDRRAPGWRFVSRGFVAEPQTIPLAELRAGQPPPLGSPGRMAWHVVQALDTETLPENAAITIDTEGFYETGVKLGLGSSAAVCVAVYGAICSLVASEPDFMQAAGIHRELQGNEGSGIDVAAAWFGGLLRFERDPRKEAPNTPAIAPTALPAGLQMGFLWAGHPAVTTAHLARFAAWRRAGGEAELDALIDASRALFETGDVLDRLRHYVDRLSDLDQAAELRIFDRAHQELHRLAGDSGVVYKPCGAGGGDIGAAFAYDPGAIERFMTHAHARGYAPIKLETAAHGIQVRR